jgi:hypothetical protein
MTGPVGLAIAGVAAVGAGIYALVDASNRQKQAQMEMWENFSASAVTSAEALEAMREKVRDLSEDMEGMAAGDTFDQRLEAARGRAIGDVIAEGVKLQKEEVRLMHEKTLAVKTYGELSRQALETEIRLIEVRQKQNLVQQELQKEQIRLARERRGEANIKDPRVMEQFGVPVSSTWYEEEQAIKSLEKAFDELETLRETAIEQLSAQAKATGDLSAVTRELTDDEKALTDAQKAAADAATEQGRAERDAARDVQDAAERVTDAEESIAEAYQDKARRVQDANRAVADAERDLADAIVAGEDRIKQAKQSAADAEQSAAERITSIRERLAELDAPELTPAQRKEKQRADLLKELAKAQEELAATRAKGVEDVRKAEDEAARMVEDAERRKADAVRARADVEAAADKRILEAYKAREKAVEALARTEERANERIAASVDKVTEANEKLAEAQAKVGGGRASGVGAVPGGSAPVATPVPVQPVYYPVATPQPRVMPQAAFAGAGAGGGQIDIYLHTPPDFVVNTAMGAADRIIGSANGRPAVVRIVRDMFARR